MLEVSIFIAVGIVSAIFLLLYGIKSKRKMPEYQKSDILLSYFVTRVWFSFMTEHITRALLINLCVDFCILIFISAVTKEDKQVQKNVMLVYLYCPFSMLAVLSGSYLLMLAEFAVLIVSLFVVSKRIHFRTVFPEYVMACIGVMGMIGSVLLFEETVKNVLIWSLLCLIYAVVMIAYKAITKKSDLEKKCEKENATKVSLSAEKSEENNAGDIGVRKIAKVDLAAMIFLTLAFFGTAVFRLGSLTVPNTSFKLENMDAADESAESAGTNEIMLDFGKPVSIAKLSIFLGYEGKRNLSFSYFDPGTNQWVVFDENHTIESVFAWNTVDVNWENIQYLGIVAMDSEAYLNEIVVKDADGNSIMPVNAEEYQTLFDEQDLYPEYATYYYRTMFDEVYHARTAYEFLHELPIYENTHPPLGKTIISIGIAIFGMNPFGYRIMCVICGTLMIPVLYLFAFRLTKKTGTAFMAAALLCTEFMHFTLSRIATIDMIVAFFVLTTFYFMYAFRVEFKENHTGKKQYVYLLLSGIFMGTSMAVKWTGVYAAAGIAVWFFITIFPYIRENYKKEGFIRELAKLLSVCIVSFIILPVIIYVLSYIPFWVIYPDRGLIGNAVDNAKLMFSYHSNTVFEHPYSSEWYEWITDKVPLLDTYTVMPDNKISAIATFGNPLVWWGGLIALMYEFYLWRCKKSRKALLLILGYLSMLAPWLLVHRTVFIYQYYISSLFLILCMADAVSHIKRRQKAVCVGITIGSLFLFALFYPVLSGYAVNADYFNQILEWIPTWKFAL